MLNQYSFLFKYIIIGDAIVGVGKSCILMQFLQNKFKIDSETTVGVEFGSKIVEIPSASNPTEVEKIKLQIWDTAGQEIFKSITRSYYRGSIGAILVYDITCRQSFLNLTKWIDQTKNYANQKLSILLVANKIDLQSKRVVSTKQGREFAETHNMLFIECTAKNSTEEVFVKLAERILDRIKSNQIDPKNQTLGIKIGTYKGCRLSSDKPDRGYCC